MTYAIKIPSSKIKEQETSNSLIDIALKEFLYEELKEVYWSELHLVDTFWTADKSAISTELKKVFINLLNVTRNQITTIEGAFKILSQKPDIKKNRQAEGVLKIFKDIIEEDADDPFRKDLKLVSEARKVKAYEISSYESIVHIASIIELNKIKAIFESLLEEKAAAYSFVESIHYDIVTKSGSNGYHIN